MTRLMKTPPGMPSSFASSGSGTCAGQELTPSFQAATIMFWAQRPASNSCGWVCAIDDDGGGIGQPASEAAEPGQRAQALAVAHNDQPVGLAVLRAARHPSCLEDPAQRLVGQRLGEKGALVALVHHGAVGIHGGRGYHAARGPSCPTSNPTSTRWRLASSGWVSRA